MYCSGCGNYVTENMERCNVCGTPISTTIENEQKLQQRFYPQQNVSSNLWNAPVPEVHHPELGMGWFKFIIYFQLFANGIINIVQAIRIFSGDVYKKKGITAEAMYSVFSEIRVLDYGYAFLCIVLGIFALVTRFYLANYKQKSPAMYLWLLGLNIGIPLLYMIFACAILNGFIDQGEYFSNMLPHLCITIGLFIYNISYFKQRKHMFVN